MDRLQAAARELRRILCLQLLTRSASWLKTYRRSRPCQATNTNTTKTTSFSRRLRRFLTKSSRIASPTKPRETASRSWLSLPVRVTSKENCFQIRRTSKPSRKAMLRPNRMTKSSSTQVKHGQVIFRASTAKTCKRSLWTTWMTSAPPIRTA